MSSASEAERSLRDGDPARALSLLQDEIRNNPSDAKLRVFLFQLLSLLGQWDRALTQLSLAAELDPAALAMAQTYREAVQCEALRTQVFEGRKSPMILGEPEPWLAYLIEALSASAGGDKGQAQSLRSKAFDEAPASAGVVDGQAFEWIADADMRLGPVLEAIVNGRYYWVPFDRLSRIVFEAPADLRDFVWMPAQHRVREWRRDRGTDPDPLSRIGEQRRQCDRAGPQDGLGGTGSGAVLRARPASPRHRRRRTIR